MALQEAMQGFQNLGSYLTSHVLLDLTTLGKRLPDFSIQLKQLLEAADWHMAEELGRVIPNKVIKSLIGVCVCIAKLHLDIGVGKTLNQASSPRECSWM